MKAWLRERGDTIRRLERGLAGSRMAGLAFVLERHGRRHRISPFFMAAIAQTESSLGAAACSGNRFNAWGLGSCDVAWKVPAFGSWDEAIAYFARFLRDRWPAARTAYDFHGYAACSPCWGRTTARHMRSLFNVGPEVTYP